VREETMRQDASGVLGATEVAGTFLTPHGLTRKMTGRVAGGVVGGGAGRVVGGVIAGGGSGGEASDRTPEFGRIGYLAVTTDEVALIRGTSGLMKPKVGTEVLARVPRSAVSSVTLDRGALKADLRVEFTDGGSWAFEVPKVNRATAERVVAALGGQVS
jgi:hypothetical protein